MISDAMSRSLELAGYTTVQVENGKKGLKAAIEQQPDLIILDYNMPDIDGLAVLDKLRADPWGHTAQVIFATNVYDVGVVNEVLRLGVKDYVMKSDLAAGDLATLAAKYVAVPHESTDNQAS